MTYVWQLVIAILFWFSYLVIIFASLIVIIQFIQKRSK